MADSTDKQHNNEDNWGLYKRLISYLLPYYKRIILVFVFNFLFVIFNTLSMWMVAPFLTALFDEPIVEQQQVEVAPPPEEEEGGLFNLNDWLKEQLAGYINTGDRLETLKILCFFIFGTFFLKNLFAFAEFYVISFVEQKVIKTLRIQVYEHVIRLPMSFFNKMKTGNLISRITNDIDAVNVALNRSFTKLIRDPILIFIYLFILLNISWQLMLLSVTVVPLTTILIQRIGKSLKRKSRRVQERLAEITNNLQEKLSGIKVVKAFAAERYEDRLFYQNTDHHFRETLRRVRLKRLSGPLSETVGVTVMVGVLWVGGQMVLDGQLLSSEDFIRFIILLYAMLQPIKSFGEMNNNIQIALASGKRMFDLMDAPRTISDNDQSLTRIAFEDKIEYHDVHFRYDGAAEPVLSGVNLTVEKKQKVALVGSSGAGKTTLVNLLPRFYEVGAGEIILDGVNIKRIRLESLRRLMGIVTQEVILFNDTVANNIAYGMDKIDIEQVKSAAKLANAYDFIMELPDQFDTIIGERGLMLSGGQRQRISIARAILKNPPILIFDEATSSLDSESEFLIQEAVENLMKDRTVLIIAHRLSSIVNADKIIVMENGQVIDSGTHGTLLESSDRYRHLYELQFST